MESEIPDSLTRYQVALRSHLENVDELIGKFLSHVVVLHPLSFISDYFLWHNCDGSVPVKEDPSSGGGVPKGIGRTAG